MLDVQAKVPDEALGLHVAVASITLMTMVGLAVWGRGMIRLLSSLLGLLFGYLCALLLGLGHEVFPDFYRTLPHWMSFFTDSILSSATVSAVSLNLLFRIGIRKSAVTTIETDRNGLERFTRMVRQEGKIWGVETTILEETTATANQVFHLIEDGRLADGPITARISFDEVSFLVDIYYSGELLRLPVKRQQTDEDMLEEQPMARGLSGFLATVHPDQMRCRINDEQCHIRLVFEM